MLLQNPQKKVESIIGEIEKGRSRESDSSLLIRILNKQPSMIHEVVRSLASIMAKGDSKPYISACLILNKMADKYPDKVSHSLEMIIEFLRYRKKELNEYEWIPTLELFTKMNQGHPENMRTAVPIIFSALGSSNATIRETAYFLLVLIAANNPDFFKDRSKELIKVLNGLNVDERRYACNIIRIIAEKNPEIVEKTFDIVEELYLNHPDNNLRREAGFVVDRHGSKTDTIKQPDINMAVAKQEDNSMIETALQKMIPSNAIESSILVDTDGREIAHSGAQIDKSLVSKLTSMIALDNDNKFKSRISIEQADKKIVAVRVGDKAILVVVTHADASIGMLLMMLNKSVEKINVLLQDA